MPFSFQRVFSYIALGLFGLHPFIYPFSDAGGIAAYPMSERDFFRPFLTEWLGILAVAVLGFTAVLLACLPWYLPVATLAQRRLLLVSFLLALSIYCYLLVAMVNVHPAPGMTLLGLAYVFALLAILLPKQA